MGSTVIVIPDGEGVAPSKETKKFDIPCQPIVSFLREKKSNRQCMKKVIHSIKVGVALVLVSLLYLLNPLYKQVGENAMWAIMTVVVVFEFFAGLYIYIYMLALYVVDISQFFPRIITRFYTVLLTFVFHIIW